MIVVIAQSLRKQDLELSVTMNRKKAQTHFVIYFSVIDKVYVNLCEMCENKCFKKKCFHV